MLQPRGGALLGHLLGLSGAVRYSPSPLLVKDRFKDANGVGIGAHTPDYDKVGGGWSVVVGSGFEIQSNKLQVGSHANSVAVIDAGSADARIRVHVTTAGNQNGMLVLRYVDNLNYWRMRFTTFGAGEIRIAKVVAGATTNYAAIITGRTGATTLHLEFEGVGSSIRWGELISGVEFTRTDTAHQLATSHGIGDLGAEATWLADKFSIEGISD